MYGNIEINLANCNKGKFLSIYDAASNLCIRPMRTHSKCSISKFGPKFSVCLVTCSYWACEER